MSTNSTLTASLIKRKGDAVPTTVEQTTEHTTMEKKHYQCLSIKIDKHRYLSLKKAGLYLDLTSQDIFLQALDMWLEKHIDQT